MRRRLISLTGMKTLDDIAKFLERQRHIVVLLTAVEELGIDDCWVGAGLIRNAVWNHLHGFPTDPVPGSDVDVVYCDPSDASLTRDLSIEARLRAKNPQVPWSVHNQSRMHVRNGDPPYRSVFDAIRCWPETATAIAARIEGSHVEVLAPHGVGDLVGLIVRPTPTSASKMPAYQKRRGEKDWKQRWPNLRFVGK
jgi:uncharacterized protein